jgi:hypothetical protein
MSTVDLAWGKGSQCVGLTTLPPSCAADSLKVLGVSQHPEALGIYLGVFRDSIYIYIMYINYVLKGYVIQVP